MTERSTVLEKLRAIAERVTASEGLELVDAEIVGGGAHRVVRIYIDKPSGVTHSDCERVSQQVGTILDVEDVIPGGRYNLEVSSPGLERKLTRPSEFERFQGHKIKVVLRQPVENSRHWTGALTKFSEGMITLEPSPGKSVCFPLEQVEKANLKFEW
jgi:ribosome maturation factor RimP